MNKEEVMVSCAEEAKKGVNLGHGGPFGAAVVKDGVVISLCHNTVVKGNDPTAHGEINAIREACRILNTFDLSDCELYTTAEPCPMCLSAIMWAGIKKVYYGCSADDTEKIGFADRFIYDYIEGKTKKKPIEVIPLMRDKCMEAFKEWEKKDGKIDYDPR